MGGNGALRNAILHPEVFSSVYALSPGILDAVSLHFQKWNSIKMLIN
jgi:S-formylglutathione hydrolase FrmB